MNALPNDPQPGSGNHAAQRGAEFDRRLTVLETRFDTILPTLAANNDLALLRSEMQLGFERMETRFASVQTQFAEARTETGAQFANVQTQYAEARTVAEVQFAKVQTQFAEMRTDMQALRADTFAALNSMTRWIIGMTVTILIAILGMSVTTFNMLNTVAASQPQQSSAPGKPASPASSLSP